MSNAQPIRPRMATKTTMAFAIVASQYNLGFVQPMVDQAYRELSELEQGSQVSLTWVPGALKFLWL